MAIIYRKNDRVKVQIHDIEVSLRPLTYHEKSEISSDMLNANMAAAALSVIKLAVKDLNGVSTPDGSKYKLEFEDDKLTDDCLDDLMNMQHSKDLILVCVNMLSQIPEEFLNAEDGEILKGVKVISENKSRKK